MGRIHAIARRFRAGRAPTLLFLPGYASDMAGAKALALDEWAVKRGQALVRFDWRGCGESGGRFDDFTLEDWRDDALAVIDATTGPLVLVGSSMGGWLMLHAALARPQRVAALVGIAAAPDFTEWDYDAAERATLHRDGVASRPNPYGPEPIEMPLARWESGQRLLVLGGAALPIACPVRLLHGQADAEVPWALSLRLAAALESADVQVTLVKDGDHRLSRPQDLALLVATVERLLETLTC